MKNKFFFLLVIPFLLACNGPMGVIDAIAVTYAANKEATSEVAPAAPAQPGIAATATAVAPVIPDDLPSVDAPAAPAAEAVEAKSICDADLMGPALNDKTAPEVSIKLPTTGEYKYLLISMDSGVLVYSGEEVDTVKGAIVFSSDSFKVLTIAGDANGVGWNDENDRWNVHACALPVEWDEIAEFRDLQFGNDNGSSGDHKPVGIVIDEGAIKFIWNSGAFTLAEFDSLFK
jgi:hypothetical protein